MQSRGVRRPSVCPSVCKLFCANRFFYHRSGWIATKLAHDGPHMDLHPGCAQDQGQRSRDTDTFLTTRKLLFLPQTGLDRHQTGTRWSHLGLHPGCAQGQDQGQRSRDTDTFLITRKTLLLPQTWLDRQQTDITWFPHGPAQGQGQRSHDTGTSVMSRNVCYTVPSDVLSLHALTLRSTVTLSFKYKCQTPRYNV